MCTNFDSVQMTTDAEEERKESSKVERRFKVQLSFEQGFVRVSCNNNHTSYVSITIAISYLRQTRRLTNIAPSRELNK